MKLKLGWVVLLISVCSASFGGESSATFKKVHLCCDECVRGVERSVKGMDGVSVKMDKDAEEVTLTAADGASLQKAADAMAAGGYFGVSDKGLKPVPKTGAQNKTVQKLIVEGAHMCCRGCADAVGRAVKATPGAEGHTAKKGSKTFVVSGNFNDQKFFEALHAEGLSGRVTTKEAEPAKTDSKADH